MNEIRFCLVFVECSRTEQGELTVGQKVPIFCKELSAATAAGELNLPMVQVMCVWSRWLPWSLSVAKWL